MGMKFIFSDTVDGKSFPAKVKTAFELCPLDKKDPFELTLVTENEEPIGFRMTFPCLPDFFAIFVRKENTPVTKTAFGKWKVKFQRRVKTGGFAKWHNRLKFRQFRQMQVKFARQTRDTHPDDGGETYVI